MTYHILIVEDNTPCAEMMTIMCRLEGHEVSVAANGQVALELLSRNSFDLVLMDVCLPVLDGLETARQLRNMPDFAEMPIIFVTAMYHPDQSDLRAISPAGILAKPFARQHLLASINQALNLQTGFRIKALERSA